MGKFKIKNADCKIRTQIFTNFLSQGINAMLLRSCSPSIISRGTRPCHCNRHINIFLFVCVISIPHQCQQNKRDARSFVLLPQSPQHSRRPLVSVAVSSTHSFVDVAISIDVMLLLPVRLSIKCFAFDQISPRTNMQSPTVYTNPPCHAAPLHSGSAS